MVSLVLPITVLIIVPLSIEKTFIFKYTYSFFAGLAVIFIGLFLMTLTISQFSRIGKGTLAPWSPTRKLIISGLYQHVRNPMIIGVLMVLTGESIAIQSAQILIWAGIFFIINHINFLVYEEPYLEQKFGNDYKEYKKNVSRWVPKINPYMPE